MFKTKTFNLVNEEENKKFEKLYDPKRCRWMRYIVIPALIGFALMLVLVNVDFSGDSSLSINENATSTTTDTVSSSYSSTIDLEVTDFTDKSTHLSVTTVKNFGHVEASSQYLQTIPPSPRNYGCAVNTNNLDDKCDIDCYGGWLEGLPGDLAKMQNNCHGYLKVLVRGYSLSGNTLKALHLNGTFQAEYLQFDSVISNLLTKIEEGAFNVDSMAHLKTLVIDKLNAPLLNENTFHGLSLQTFNMTNQPKKFVGTRFLQPFVKSLLQLMLRQTDTKTIFDPTNWLQGARFPLLWQLDLSTINFGNTLRGETFQMLDAIREIYLMKCQITNIAEGTFDAVAKTLKILDLSNNQLKTLDANFLSHVNGTLKLELQDNEWNCTCENDQLINSLKGPEITYGGEPVCGTPEELKNTPLIYIHLECTGKITTTDESSGESDETTEIITTTPFKTPPTKTTTAATVSPPSPTETLIPNDTTSDDSTDSIDSTDSTGSTDSIVSTDSTTATTYPTGTTPNSHQHLSLYCRSSFDRSSEEDNSITVRDCDAFFRIIAQTECNATFAIESDVIDLQLIYFLPRNSTYVNVTNDELTSPYAGRTTEINVIGLTPQQLYVFCLIPKNEQKISPFNCLSLYLQTAHISKPIWLSKSDIGWAITVFIIGLIMALGCGLVVVYFLLRCRPTWLCGSKRIIRKGSSSREVYLIPKKREENAYTEGGDAYGKLDIKSYDYMQFYKDLQDSKQNRTIQVNAQMSPYERAPTLPGKSQSRTPSLPTTIESTIENEDNDYQSISYYEQMN